MTSSHLPSHDLSTSIDLLFQSYLLLLDQYTTLCTQLSTAQISTQQFLARANFHAPAGVRYGEPMYDGRMQASRRCTISGEGGGLVIAVGLEKVEVLAEEKDKEVDLEQDEVIPSADTPTKGHEPAPIPAPEPSSKSNSTSKPKPKPKDPLHQFGILTPQSLKQAQSTSISMLETTIPALLKVSTEMAELEIQIRRLRKFRGKAELAEERERVESGMGQGEDKVAAVRVEV